MTAIQISWRQRQRALAPSAAVVDGPAASALARRPLVLDDAELSGLRGVTSGDLLCVLAEGERLPWVDGIEYYGRDPRAPGPLWPTAFEPTPPAALVATALARASQPGSQAARVRPFAVLHRQRRLLPLDNARPIHRPVLAAWLDSLP